jgi:hypothetical protein
MKHLKHLTAALVFVSLIVFTSCGGSKGGDKSNPAADQAEKIVGSWTLAANGAKLESQSVDGWTGFTLTYTGDENGGSFTTTNSASTDVWPASGTWTFDGDDIGTISRNDGVLIDISAVTSSSLTLAFTINTSARGSSVDGNWTFSFTK